MEPYDYDEATRPIPTAAPPPAAPDAPPPPVRPWWLRIFRSRFGALIAVGSVLLAIVLFAALGGYAAGVVERQTIAATAEAAELRAQFELAQQDYLNRLYDRAIQRLDYILERQPDFPGAAALRQQAQADRSPGADPAPAPTLALPTATPLPLSARPSEAELRTAIEAAQAAEDWDTMLDVVIALRAEYPDVPDANSLMFTALRNSGVQHILASPAELELGLFYLNEAAKLGTLDADAEQAALWAQIYINGMAIWGVNWARSVEAFDTLNLIAPYFHDTQSRRYQAHLGFADTLAVGGAPCDAVIEYDIVLSLSPGNGVEEKRTAAEEACLNPTPTPTPDPNATLDPNATPDPNAPPTATPDPAATPTLAPDDGGDLLPTATPTLTPAP